jgi:hypothetical protein
MSPAISTVAVQNRIQSIESSIAQISKDLSTVCIKLQARSQDRQSINLSEDSEELTEIAANLVKEASSIASSARSASSASTVGSEASTIRSTAQRWESISLDGMPMGPQMKDRIQSWRKTLWSSASSLSTTTGTSNALIKSSASSVTYVTDQNDDADLDFEQYFLIRRYNYAKELCLKKQFKQAIPHIEKTLDSFTDSTETSIRRSVLIILIQAQLELPEIPRTTAQHLANALKYSEADETHEVLHLQARVEFKANPKDPEIAQQTCLKAIKARASQFGRKHKLTVESIQLMSDICVESRDQDGVIWAREEGVRKVWHRDDVFALVTGIPLIGLPILALLAMIYNRDFGFNLVFFGIPWYGFGILKSQRNKMMNWEKYIGDIIICVGLFITVWVVLLAIKDYAEAEGGFWLSFVVGIFILIGVETNIRKSTR